MGLRELVVGTLLLAAVGAVCAWLWWPLVVLPLAVWVWLLAFFRDPERAIPDEPDVLVSPADGTISDITSIPEHPQLGGPAVSIGIFLSVFDVHINRSPCDGRVLSAVHTPGKFINALRHREASALNEANTVLLGDVETGRPLVVVRQIVGLIARRIVFTPRVGTVLRRGERIGMMKFGSRTELIVPTSLQPQVLVTVGQKVRGGSDVVVRLGAGSRAFGSARPLQETAV